VGSALESRQRGLSNEEAVVVLQRYGPLIQRWVSRFSPNRADSEDAYHEVFLKLLIYGAQFRVLVAEADRHRWLKTLAVRVCLTRQKRARRFPELLAPWLRAHDGADAGIDSLRAQFEHSEFQQTEPNAESLVDWAAFWNTLQAETRVIGVLYFVEGYTHEEIHELTGRGRPFVAKTLSSIREKMARRSRR
jgi:RNA polymerase sigma factor (sigma-70 family)